MTVSSTENRKEYAGNGVTTAFATSPVVFFVNADLTVYVVNNTTGAVTTLVLNTNYTVSGGNGSTGTVNLAGGSSPYGAPATGTTLVIVRDLAITQGSDFVNNDGSDAEVAEDALDRLTMIAQQLDARIDRSFALADSDISGASTVIPTPKASTIIGWNSAGTALQNYAAAALDTALTTPFTLTLLDDANAATARTTLGLGSGDSPVFSKLGIGGAPLFDMDVVKSTGGGVIGAVRNTGSSGYAQHYVEAAAAGDDPFQTFARSGGVSWSHGHDVTDGKYKVGRSGTLGINDFLALDANGNLAARLDSPGVNIVNGYLQWTVAGNVLTVALKTRAGSDPSSIDPVYIQFRDATAGTGSSVWWRVEVATSISINDTATLGTANNTAFRLWCVAFDDAGTVRLGIINCLSGTNIYPLAGWGIASSTLEDNASDSAHVFYSGGAAVAAKAYATLGYATWETGLATAGTWSAAPTRAQLFGLGTPLPGAVIQSQATQTGAVATGTTTIPADDTIPQITEGDEYLTQAITPSSAANLLEIDSRGVFANSSAGGTFSGALFKDATTNALASTMHSYATAGHVFSVGLRWVQLAAGTIAQTWRLRAGNSAAGTTTLNGAGSARLHGGAMNSYLVVVERMA